MQTSNDRCFACGRKLGKHPHEAVTSDGQVVFVGSECFNHIGVTGWQPPKGGPVLHIPTQPAHKLRTKRK